jgi:hypothetical protein
METLIEKNTQIFHNTKDFLARKQTLNLVIF